MRLFGRTEKMFFTTVYANNEEDALNQFSSVTLFCGEPIVYEVFE
jgi:hypothetical protein